MTIWTLDKFLRMYEYETKSEVKKLFPNVTYNKNLSDVATTDDEKVFEQLREFHEKMKGSIELYGTVEEMFEYFKRIDRIEMNEFSYPFTFPKYTDISGNIICVSNSDVLKYIKSSLMEEIEEFSNFLDIDCKQSFAGYIYYISGLEVKPIYRYHKLITDDSWKSLYDKLCDMCNIENLGYVEPEAEHREKNDLLKLLGEFKESKWNRSYIINFVDDLKKLETPNIKKIYAVVSYFHNAIKPLRKELQLLVEPIKKASPDFKPIIRRFKGAKYEFYLAKEVSDAFPEENIDIDNNNDRQRVTTVDSSTFDRILEKYGADSVTIVEIPIETNSRNNTYPIYCSLGDHCRPVWEEIEENLYDIIVHRKHFEGTEEQASSVYDLIELKEFRHMFENPALYLVNVTGCELHLRQSMNWSAKDTKIPYKRAYTKQIVIEIIKKMVKNQSIKDEEIQGIIDKVFEVIPYGFLNYKQIHDLYYQIILRNILKLCPKIARLKENQGKYKKNHESNLVYKAVEEFYESKKRNIFDSETTRIEALQNEIIDLKRCEKNYHEEISRLKEQLEKAQITQLEENRKLKEQFEKRERNHLEKIRKLEENQEKYEKQQQDLLRVVSELKTHVYKSQNDLIDSISSNLNNLSFIYPNSKEIEKAKRDLEKFEENVNVFE